MSQNAPHPLVQLAKTSISAKINGLDLEPSSELVEAYPESSGVFVTLKSNGRLRGCIGSLFPKTKSLAQEVARNARLAAFNDPRFQPVTQEELEPLNIQIEVLTPTSPVKDLIQLDPTVDGIVVKSGSKQGVLLPGIEGVTTVEQQIAICREKGGIKKKEPVEYFTFQVRHIV